MKKIHVLFVVPMLLAALPVSAQGTATTSRDKMQRDNAMERREFFMERAEERKELFKKNQTERRELFTEQKEERAKWFSSSTSEWKSRMSEVAKERIKENSQRFARLFDAIIERLAGFADRIEARIAELDAAGADTAAAEAALATADAKIAAAADLVDEFSEDLAEALASENPRESFLALKPKKDEVKLAIRAAHSAIKAAVLELKNIQRTATSTTSN